MREIVWYKRKVVGYVSDDVFHTVREEKHIFKKYESINISKEVLDCVKQKGVKRVEIQLKIGDNEEIFRRSLADIETHRTYTYEDDEQYVLPLNELRNNPHGQRVIPLDAYLGSKEKGVV